MPRHRVHTLDPSINVLDRHRKASLSRTERQRHETHHLSRVRRILMPLDATLYKFYGFPSRLTVFLSRTFHHSVGVVLSSGDTTATLQALLSAGGTNQSHTVHLIFSLLSVMYICRCGANAESVWCNCERHVPRCLCILRDVCACDARDGTRTPTVSIANYEISSAGDLYPWADLPVSSSMSTAEREREIKKADWNFFISGRRAFLEMREWLRNAVAMRERDLVLGENGLMEVLGCT